MTDAVTHHADSVTHHAIPDAADKASNRRKHGVGAGHDSPEYDQTIESRI
jgi:hypothetical protein